MLYLPTVPLLALLAAVGAVLLLVERMEPPAAAAEEGREEVLRGHEVLLVLLPVLLRHAVLVAVPVVDLPLLLVRQALHGLGDLLEGLLGARRLVLVGVELQSQLLVRPLHFILSRTAGYIEDVVVVLRSE